MCNKKSGDLLVRLTEPRAQNGSAQAPESIVVASEMQTNTRPPLFSSLPRTPAHFIGTGEAEARDATSASAISRRISYNVGRRLPTCRPHPSTRPPVMPTAHARAERHQGEYFYPGRGRTRRFYPRDCHMCLGWRTPRLAMIYSCSFSCIKLHVLSFCSSKKSHI